MATFRGFKACSCLIEWLPVYEAELKRRGLIQHSIDIWQLIGGAAASAGTHTKGGAFDIKQSGEAIKVARLMGADATWRRTKAQGFSLEHTHGVLRGCPHNTPARYQITAVDAGYNGLGRGGRGGKDNGPKPLSHRTWQEGIAWAKAQAAPVAPVKPKPSVKHLPWFTLTQWSLAGFDVVYGEKHWKTLEPKIVAEIAALAGEVFALTEVPGDRIDNFDKALRKVGYRVVVSTDGRTIVAADSVRSGRVKKITLKERGPAKDDKQIVLAELWPTTPGQSWLIECGHLEHRAGDAYDNARVKQAKEIRTLTADVAERWGIPSSRVAFANDENSGAWVRDKAFNPEYDDASVNADKSSNTAFATICGWTGKTAKGERTDRVEVHRDRPVVAFQVLVANAKKKLSDHLPTRVVLGKN